MPKGVYERKTTDAWNRFWAKVAVVDGGCWEWQAGKNPLGYGWFNWGGKCWLAYRVALIWATGDNPAGLSALHSCDNPPCVNPDHLRWGTHQENMQEAAERGLLEPAWSYWRNKTHCKRGHEFTSENTRIYRGSRHCRACHRDYMRERNRKGK